MEITHVFAGLAVTDYESARGWYERLLGAPGDSGEDGPRKAVVNDPDGNTIAFFEGPRGGN